MTKLCAIYVRISADKEGDAESVGNQEKDCRKLAEQLGYTVAEPVFNDNDISASRRSKKPRPRYEAMMRRAEAGEFVAIIANTTSRLTRRPLEYERLIDLVEQRGVLIRTVKSGKIDLASADGRMVARILAAADSAEAERTSERLTRLYLGRAEKGLYHGGSRPFGYRKVGPTSARRLEIVEEEAELLREAARRVLDGEHMRSIERDWRERDIRTVGGQFWRQANLRRALLSPRNIGVREHRPSDAAGRKPKFGEGAMYEAKWEPIFKQETWDALHIVLDDEARCFNTSAGRVHTLSGFIFCGLCGARMKISTGASRARKYACPPAPDGCNKMARVAAPIEDLVRDTVLHWLDSGLYESTIAAAESDGQYRELMSQRLRLQAQVDRLVADYADGNITAAEMRQAKQRVEPLLAEADRAIAERRVVRAVPDGTTLRESWSTLQLERRRTIVAALVERVLVHPTLVGRTRFDPTRIQIIPGPWAAGLDADLLLAPVVDIHQLRGQALRDAILGYLADNADASPSQIANELGVDLSTTVKTLKRLAELGSVVRTRELRGREPSLYRAA